MCLKCIFMIYTWKNLGAGRSQKYVKVSSTHMAIILFHLRSSLFLYVYTRFLHKLLMWLKSVSTLASLVIFVSFFSLLHMVVMIQFSHQQWIWELGAIWMDLNLFSRSGLHWSFELFWSTFHLFSHSLSQVVVQLIFWLDIAITGYSI